MAGSVSRARYKRRPKGNFLTGVITRPCVHTSSPATFPQLLAQLALPGLDAPSTVARDRVLATDSTDSNASAYRSIKPFRHQCLWKCHRSWKEWFFSPDDWNFFFFFRSFVRLFLFFFFDVEFVDEISPIEIHWWGILSRIFIDFTDFTVIRERN